MAPSKHNNEHSKQQHSDMNPYVKLTRLTDEDMEKYTSKTVTNEHLKEQHSDMNPYVKLTRLTDEDMEKYTSKIVTNEHLKEQHSDMNPYVKLTRLTDEDMEKYTSKTVTNKHLKEQHSDMNPYVKLTRLTDEDMEKYTSKTVTNEHLKEQHSDMNPYVKLTRLTDEDMEKYTSKNHETEKQFIIISDLIEVKIEPEDENEATDSSTFSNCLERNCFICYECYDFFDDYTEFVIHKNLSHNSKPYVCYTCNAQFVLSAHLNLHFAEHDLCLRNSSINPSEVQSSSRSNSIINLSHNINDNNSNIAKFQKCDFCLQIFNSLSALNNHLQYDTHRFQIN